MCIWTVVDGDPLGPKAGKLTTLNHDLGCLNQTALRAWTAYDREMTQVLLNLGIMSNYHHKFQPPNPCICDRSNPCPLKRAPCPSLP